MKTVHAALLGALPASGVAQAELATVLNSADASVSFIDMTSQKVVDTVILSRWERSPIT